MQGQGFVRNYEVQIEVDCVSESLAARAGAVRVVKGEQTRLRLFISNIANLTFEALGEAQRFRGLSFARSRFEDDLTRFAITDLNRIDDPGAGLRRYR